MNVSWFETMSSKLDSVAIHNNKIDIKTFLNSMDGNLAEAYKILFGGEGIIQSQLAGDLNNNLSKIRRHYETSPEKHDFESLIAYEVEKYGLDKILAEKEFGAKGVLWLSRTINFITTLLENLIKRGSQLPSDIAVVSYNETLKPYHGFIASTTFSAALRWMTDMETLLKQFKLPSEAEFKRQASIFVTKMRPLITHLFAILDKQQVNFQYKV